MPERVPAELKRRRGTDRKDRDGDPARKVGLKPIEDATPPAHLLKEGREAWVAVLASPARNWISESDRPALLAYAELVEEYYAIRSQYLKDVTDWRLGKRVNDVRAQMFLAFNMLGITPQARAALGVAEVRTAQAVAQIALTERAAARGRTGASEGSDRRKRSIIQISEGETPTGTAATG